MPTYEYRCTSCGKHIEVVQSFSDDPLTECPTCSGELRKVFSPVGIVFKGSGFYKTDNRGSGSGKKKEPAADSTSKSTSDSTSKSKESTSSSSSSSESSTKDSKIA